MKKRRAPFSPARRRFLKTAAAAAAVGLGTPAYGYEIEADRLEVMHREVTLTGWPRSASGLKIGQLSDMHCQNSHAAALLLLAEEPDVVFLTGDYISGNQIADWSIPACDALAPLRNVPHGVYAVLGNHDFADGHSAQLAAALSQVGFHVLRNRAVPLPGGSGVWVVGMDSRSVAAQDPVGALRDVPKDAVKILLIHEPDYADEAPPGFSIQFSGHSHAGQVRVPGLPPLLCPTFGRRYPEGLQQAAHHLVYTTRGVGMMGPQMRLFCPPEVTVLTIHSA